MTAWKLYYEDGVAWSSDDGSWMDAPSPTGVVGLAIPHKDHGRQILTGDVYLFQEGHAEPQASDIFGAMSHLLNQGVMAPHEPLFKVPPQSMWDVGIYFGFNADNDHWAELWKWMVNDADNTWPPRSGTAYGRERR